MTERGRPATKVAEWAGHSFEVLLTVYAKCIRGRDPVWFERIDKAGSGHFGANDHEPPDHEWTTNDGLGLLWRASGCTSHDRDKPSIGQGQTWDCPGHPRAPPAGFQPAHTAPEAARPRQRNLGLPRPGRSLA